MRGVRSATYKALTDWFTLPLTTLGNWVKPGGLLGETQKFRSQSSVTGDAYALSPEQQNEAIRLNSEMNALKMSFPEKPEGYIFLIDFARSLEISYGKLSNWMKTGKLGGKDWRFRNPSSPTGIAFALSPEQQTLAIRFKMEKEAKVETGN